MTPDQLKASILQYAMEGKLVSQNPSDQPASELLAEIQQEKAQLVKEKKIKKTKPLPEISEDEIPFEIPDSWEWVRLGNIVNILSGRDMPKYLHLFNKVEGSIPYITGASNITNGVVSTNTWIKNPVTVAHLGDILLTVKGTIGKIAILEIPHAQIARQLMALSVYPNIQKNYIVWFLNWYISDLQSKARSLIPGVSREDVSNGLVPLPPLAEQKRIVDKLDRIMPLIDEYAKPYTHLAEIDSSFNDRMKKSILQFAMEGKLVPQDPSDHPASELVAEIQQEKAQLVKEKKLKKTKPLPEISEDEIPFEIPDSWEWVRLGNITVVSSGGTPAKSRKEYWNNGNIPWITPAMMGRVSGKIYNGKVDYINEVGLAKSSAQLIQANSIVYSSRAPIGHINIVPFDYTTNQGCKSITIIKGIVDYFYYLLIERTSEIQGRASGTTFKEISGSKFAETLIPLPPLAEQKRIVDKIEKMFEILI